MNFSLETGLYPLLAQWLHITDGNMSLLLLLGCAFLAGIIGYFLGSINTAVLISRVFYRDDIRKHGSGNAGTTNMLRTFGKGAAVCTLLGDVIKTVLAILIAYVLEGSQWQGAYAFGVGAYLAALGCVMGHIFPIYHKFRGGKGVLCAATAICMLSPWVFLIIFVIFVATVAITKYVSLGSCVSALTYPIFLSSLLRATGVIAPFHMALTSIAICVLIIFMHRENIKRLQKGEENRLSFSKKEKETPEE